MIFVFFNRFKNGKEIISDDHLKVDIWESGQVSTMLSIDHFTKDDVAEVFYSILLLLYYILHFQRELKFNLSCISVQSGGEKYSRSSGNFGQIDFNSNRTLVYRTSETSHRSE